MEKRGLNPAVITRAALTLLDEVGLAELSTRRLAAKLGVQSPTLYWHVRSKGDLLDLVAEALYADAAPATPTPDWREEVTRTLGQFRALLAEHRDMAALLRERPPGPRRTAHTESLTATLTDAGFSPTEATAGTELLLNHTLNATQAHYTPGLDIILDGLAHRLT